MPDYMGFFGGLHLFALVGWGAYMTYPLWRAVEDEDYDA